MIAAARSVEVVMLLSGQMLSSNMGAGGIGDGSAGGALPSAPNASGVAVSLSLESLAICRKVSPESFTSKMLSTSAARVAR